MHVAGEPIADNDGLIDPGKELLVRQAERGGDQRVDVDLARAAENDAVLVDHVDLALGLDGAEDLARCGARILTRFNAIQFLAPAPPERWSK